MAPESNPPHPSPATSFWQQKPWWCQPWSILLTGVSGMGGAWWAYQHLHAPWWLVAPFLLAILGWWFLFLVVVPSSYPKLD